MTVYVVRQMVPANRPETDGVGHFSTIDWDSSNLPTPLADVLEVVYGDGQHWISQHLRIIR